MDSSDSSDYHEEDMFVCIQLYVFIIWLALLAGKMKQILFCDWLPEQARWAYLDFVLVHKNAKKNLANNTHISTIKPVTITLKVVGK